MRPFTQLRCVLCAIGAVDFAPRPKRDRTITQQQLGQRGGGVPVLLHNVGGRCCCCRHTPACVSGLSWTTSPNQNSAHYIIHGSSSLEHQTWGAPTAILPKPLPIVRTIRASCVCTFHNGKACWLVSVCAPSGGGRTAAGSSKRLSSVCLCPDVPGLSTLSRDVLDNEPRI